MKVLFYLPTPGGLTGAPRRLINLALALKDNGLSVCIAADIGSQLFQEASRLGISTLPIHENGVLSLRNGALFTGSFVFKLRVLFALFLHNLRFWKAIRSYNADVVWIRASKGIAFAGVGTFCSGRPLIWDVDYELPSKGAIRYLHRFGLWLAKKVVFQYRSAPDSIFGKNLADKYREKFESIIPGIDIHRLTKSFRTSLDNIRGDKNRFVILQVGTICERKNQLFTLSVLDLVEKLMPGERWELWLAYDEIRIPEFNKVISSYSENNKVKLLGWKENIWDVMRQADLLVMPSLDEGVPNTVQEAMTLGLPVLASPAGGTPEIISDGVTGWVLPINEKLEWAKRIVWCIRNRKALNEIGTVASSIAKKEFGMAPWGDKYTNIIIESVSGTSMFCDSRNKRPRG